MSSRLSCCAGARASRCQCNLEKSHYQVCVCTSALLTGVPIKEGLTKPVDEAAPVPLPRQGPAPPNVVLVGLACVRAKKQAWQSADANAHRRNNGSSKFHSTCTKMTWIRTWWCCLSNWLIFYPQILTNPCPLKATMGTAQKPPVEAGDPQPLSVVRPCAHKAFAYTSTQSQNLWHENGCKPPQRRRPDTPAPTRNLPPVELVAGIGLGEVVLEVLPPVMLAPILQSHPHSTIRLSRRWGPRGLALYERTRGLCRACVRVSARVAYPWTQESQQELSRARARLLSARGNKGRLAPTSARVMTKPAPWRERALSAPAAERGAAQTRGARALTSPFCMPLWNARPYSAPSAPSGPTVPVALP